MELKDLHPADAELIINGKTYHFKKFSLAARAWADAEFATKECPNGLMNLSEKVARNNTYVVCKCMYHLLKDKTDFPNLDSFIDAMGTNLFIMQKVFPAFERMLGISEPKRDEDLDTEQLEKKSLKDQIGE